MEEKLIEITCKEMEEVCKLLADNYKDTPDMIKKTVKEPCSECGRIRKVIRNNYSAMLLKYSKRFKALSKIKQKDAIVEEGEKE